jgi:integrase
VSARRTYGSLRKMPSGSWQVRYTGPDGKRRNIGVYPTRAEADGALAMVLSDVHHGTYRAPEIGAVIFGDYARRWLSRQPNLAPRTRALYGRLLQAWLLAEHEVSESWAGARVVCLDRYEVRSLSEALVAEWYSAVVEHARRRAQARAESASQRGDAVEARAWGMAQGLDVKPTGRLSPMVLEAWQRAGRPQVSEAGQPGHSAGATQAAQAYRLLRTICTQLVRERMLPANPCQIRGAGHVRAAERVPATVGEVEAISALMPPRYRAAVLVAAWSGLRASELFALQRKHVDQHRGTVRVERALIEIPGHPISYGQTKSESGRRTVHLPRGAAAALVEHLRMFTGPGANALVFATEHGAPLHSGPRTKMFTRAREAVGRPDLRWHDLRHTGATLAAAGGATLPELQKRLGHSTVRAALIYQHATADADQRLAERLSEIEQARNVVSLVSRTVG